MQLLEGTEPCRRAIESANQKRAFSASPALENQVRAICEAIRTEGDSALLRFCRQFDCAHFSLEDLRVPESSIRDAWNVLPTRVQKALEHAKANISAFHERQKPQDFEFFSSSGALLGNRFTPISRVGIYAPNGRAAYPSTVLMLAVPALVAGVRDVVLATPASRDGCAHPVILAAAHLAGIREIYLMGGASAAAAFAYGTASVPRVEKIAGPGSIYLTLAKKQLFGVVGIDGLYGPSEVAVVAQGNQDAGQLAADLLAQAEHGGDSFVIFLSPSRSLGAAVLQELQLQAQASTREHTALQALQNSLFCCPDSFEDACELANLCAAEHVEIWSDHAREWAALIPNAGAIFLNCPVPLGDYIAGPSHTLPTGATARFASGVGVETFLKRTSIVEAPPQATASLAPDLEVIALLEELPAHAAAVRRAGAP